MKKDRIDDFYSSIKCLNEIIADSCRLKLEHQHWMKEREGNLKLVLSPYSNRWFRIMASRGLLPMFLSKKRKLSLLNFIYFLHKFSMYLELKVFLVKNHAVVRIGCFLGQCVFRNYIFYFLHGRWHYSDHIFDLLNRHRLALLLIVANLCIQSKHTHDIYGSGKGVLVVFTLSVVMVCLCYL